MEFIINFFIDHTKDPIFISFWLLGLPYFFVLFYPENIFTKRIVYAWTSICGLIYFTLIAYHQPNLLKLVYYSYSTTEGFRELNMNSWLGWAIFLQIIGWDLFIGYLLSLDAKFLKIPNKYRILFLCFYMHYPPFCFMLYMLYRLKKHNRLPSFDLFFYGSSK